MRWEIRGRPNSVLERPAASITATSFQFCRRKRKRIIRLVVCFFTFLFSTFPRSRYSSRNAVKSDGGRRDRFTKPFLSFFFCSAFGVRVKSVSRTLPLHLPSLEVERAKKTTPFLWVAHFSYFWLPFGLLAGKNIFAPQNSSAIGSPDIHFDTHDQAPKKPDIEKRQLCNSVIFCRSVTCKALFF